MTDLPERRRSSPPQAWEHVEAPHDQLVHLDAMRWRPVRRGPSFTSVILLTAVCAAVVGWLVRSAIDHPRTPQPAAVARPVSEPPAPPEPATAPRSTGRRCSYPDGRINDWPNGPIDVFHFLPSCDRGR
jgi:hypothetical protein